MYKRFLHILLLALSITVQGCSQLTPTSPDTSGEVDNESIPSINIFSPSPNPSSQEIGEPSPPFSAEPSLLENQEKAINVRVLLGTYSDCYQTDRNSVVKYINWVNGRDMSVYHKNNVVMGKLTVFVSSFKFILDNHDNMFTLLNHKGDELILTISSDIAKLNGEDILLDAPVEYIKTTSIDDNENIFIPLSCVAKMMGLDTMSNEYCFDNRRYLDLRISKCGILSEKEFIANKNFRFMELRGTDDGNGLAKANIYTLKENGETYSGVKLGSKYEDIILTFGEPQYREVFASKEKCIISYDLNPEELNEYSDGMQLYFNDGILEKIELHIYVWDD
jgi:hypothetical protein